MFDAANLRRSRLLLMVGVLMSVLLLSHAATLLAQDAVPATSEPVLQITKVDVSQFPNVGVYVYGENLGQPLADGPLKLSEDGTERVVADSTMKAVGVQIALVLDAGSDISEKGVTGDPRHLEVGKAARQLVKLQLLSPETDWLTTISFGEDKKVTTLHPWSTDHQAVADSLYIYKPVPNIGYTPLFDLLRFALKQFDDATVPTNLQKSIVVFSNGVDASSTTELNDAVNLASNKNIRIHTVMVGPERPETARNLKRIAELTNGQYYQLTSIEALDPLWKMIAATSNQRVLTYHTQNAHPREVAVSIDANGKKFEQSAPIPEPNLLPVGVTIVQPTNGFVIARNAPRWDTPLQEIASAPLEIQLRYDFGGHPRELRKVEFDIGGVVTQTTQPVETFSFPTTNLETNSYTIRVKVVDELGLESNAEAVQFKVNVTRPATPVPTPDATLVASAAAAATTAAQANAKADVQATEAAEQMGAATLKTKNLTEQLQGTQVWLQRLGWVSLGSMLFGVVALALAIYVLSNRERRQRATEVITGTIKAVTEPYMRPGKKGSARGRQAQLELVDSAGGNGLPPTIPLGAGSVRMGRDSNLVNVVLDDRRVSRFHCRVAEEANGAGFRIWDEGSTSGTYVNDEEVGHTGFLLHPEDIIQVGPIQYRYVGPGEPRSDMPEEEEDPKFKKTEAFVKTLRK